MPPREIREFASPLLQPPVNRLFVPRPLPDYITPQDRDVGERTGPRLSSVAMYIAALTEAARATQDSSSGTVSAETRRKQQREERKRIAREKMEHDLATWNPKERQDEPITTDPFKTVFVGGLSYSITERQLRHEFGRFGEVKKVAIVKDTMTEKPRGYAFIEFERERDVRLAFADGDGMKIDGRRVVVDIERGRTVRGWKPRRLGGGLGGTRIGSARQNQRFSGRDPRASISGDANAGAKRARSRSRERDTRHRH